MIFSFSLILIGIAVLLWGLRDQSFKSEYLEGKQEIKEVVQFGSAIKLESLQRTNRLAKVRMWLRPAFMVLGDKAWLKLITFLTFLCGAGVYVNGLLQVDNIWLPLILPTLGFFWGWNWLMQKRQRVFDNTFPDALNIMMSAVSSGESIMQAICYVGHSLDNQIGQEFRDMGDRLKLGEPPEQVFQRACKRFPYPPFLFFIVTIRANMSRGGQLKSVMARLIRVLMDARTLDKKKAAMTSEARLSAKIVASLPFFFMILLSYLSPQNLDFILTDPSGRYVLYYVVGSEVLGMFIIWLLIRRVH
ncbi:type II secretion system F family protein [Shewanella sp. D64]|uniref:type II secretion system F family protein n=1 Tax=unclassified Shewanella TaxID=196818 RepID=UPI0022BA2525|nr:MULTISPECIES: type II secretion system F family protein [unclassified Shewanella]MEC4725709.1 type II secretion system F family protein [Shewanella sp. D64]MEC4737684.1 type II secretion system F family protein [Shewanella sp. E94]WBJ93491.1 type II secretion system F family protein [Shewanella sp. MTB7]